MDENLLKDMVLNWDEITITLSHYGRAPKKLGEDVYKFGAQFSLPVILQPLGWELVSKGKSYVYLKPPDGIRPPFIVKVAVPNEEQAKEIFHILYAEGKSWAGRIGNWLAIYLHKHQYQSFLLSNNPETGKIVKHPHSQSEPVSSLKLGENGAWYSSVEMRNGEIVYFPYRPDKRF